MSAMDEQLDSLIEHAKACRELPGDCDPEEVISRIRAYLEDFDSWQKAASELDASTLSDDEQQQARSKIELLGQLHAEVSTRAETAKERIAGELSDLHKRNKALKTYLDRYPSRISITGKRKG